MKKAKLLWVDLEMTGLDPAKDKIIEVAAIATDYDLNELTEYQSAVKVSDKLIKSRMVGKFWDENPASYTALVENSKNGKSIKEVERELLALLDKYFSTKHPVYLAGNSIHQDRKFIEREMPELNKRLHYRMLDVSAWKIYFENALNKKFTKPEEHRALDDIRGSIGELQWYLTMLK